MSDRKIVLVTTIPSVMITGISVLFEIMFKYINREAHIGYWQRNVYLGAKLEDLNPAPWFLVWTLFIVGLLVVAWIVYWIVRRR